MLSKLRPPVEIIIDREKAERFQPDGLKQIEERFNVTVHVLSRTLEHVLSFYGRPNNVTKAQGYTKVLCACPTQLYEDMRKILLEPERTGRPIPNIEQAIIEGDIDLAVPLTMSAIECIRETIPTSLTSTILWDNDLVIGPAVTDKENISTSLTSTIKGDDELAIGSTVTDIENIGQNIPTSLTSTVQGDDNLAIGLTVTDIENIGHNIPSSLMSTNLNMDHELCHPSSPNKTLDREVLKSLPRPNSAIAASDCCQALTFKADGRLTSVENASQKGEAKASGYAQFPDQNLPKNWKWVEDGSIDDSMNNLPESPMPTTPCVSATIQNQTQRNDSTYPPINNEGGIPPDFPFLLKPGYTKEDVDTYIMCTLGERLPIGQLFTNSTLAKAFVTGCMPFTLNPGYTKIEVDNYIISLHNNQGSYSESNLLPHHLMSPTPHTNLRPISIDGSNVAFAHGKSIFGEATFSCKGIKIVIDYFKRRGHQDVKAFVPKYRERKCPKDLWQAMCKDCTLVVTPTLHYDDNFTIGYAFETNGVVVSNDYFRDVRKKETDWQTTIDTRVLPFVFAGDTFMPARDPLGRCGPDLDTFLKNESTPHRPSRFIGPDESCCSPESRQGKGDGPGSTGHTYRECREGQVPCLPKAIGSVPPCEKVGTYKAPHQRGYTRNQLRMNHNVEVSHEPQGYRDYRECREGQVPCMPTAIGSVLQCEKVGTYKAPHQRGYTPKQLRMNHDVEVSHKPQGLQGLKNYTPGNNPGPRKGVEKHIS